MTGTQKAAGESDSQTVAVALVLAVKSVLRKGLPLRPTSAPQVLLALDGVTALSVRPQDPLARLDALDRLLRRELRRLELVELRRSAAVLFGLVGSGTLTERRRRAAEAAEYESDHFRKRVEPKIVEQLAWQLYRDSLQYVQRPEDGGPFAASGDTPVIDEDDLANAVDATREELVSRIWSDVYGLRAELIAREASRGDSERQAEFEEAAVGALWYLARLLTRLDRFMERYGTEILHGSASFGAEGLVRLAGWTGDVTAEQARDLRFRIARVGEWDRGAFVAALRDATDSTHFVDG